MDKDVQQLDSGVSPEWLRHEQEQAHFNELYLLAPCGYFVVGFDGTGHASLAYLKRYDIDLVKIDPSLAQTLDGEGGELAMLVDAGCDDAQGYRFGRPMTASELEALALR